jgi:hypothetical protein
LPDTTVRPFSIASTLFLVFLALPLFGQTPAQFPPAFSHPLQAQEQAFQPARHAMAAPETLRVLAAMVSFQHDKDNSTTGIGSFDLSDTLGRVIDAAPHTRSYFQHHLTFAQNYYRTVSGGRVIILPTVLDSVYRMPFTIAHYSPPRSSVNNAQLGSLVEDVWHAVDSVTPGLITAQPYDIFVIFHAGVGRDINLAAIYGFDPAPHDIPSLFFNLAGLRKIYGPSYPGVAVTGGTVTNSIILPETESRIIPTAVGSSLVQLGINGLLVASIGSYLGLPDLFNTKSGASGIGRFGLMDGESIFSWGGVFPPAPSAWERTYLGWTQPVTVAGGDSVYSFPAVSLAGQPDSVYRILVSEQEYFLVENRNRDAHRDGATITMVLHDSVFTRTWLRDATRFNAFDTRDLFGVVTDVDEYDWSLPGGVNSETGEFFDGGLLIWHIDERVIDSAMPGNTVNANTHRKGVNLMEADGSQDIGQSYSLLDPGLGSESGSVIDYWYQGNKAPLRLKLNAFTPTSHPGSMSNDGANSHITIKEFSPRGPHMTARILVGDNIVSPFPGFPVATGRPAGANAVKAADIAPGSNLELIVPAGPLTVRGGTVSAWQMDGTPVDSPAAGAGNLIRVALSLRDSQGGHLIDPPFVSAHAGQPMTNPVILDTFFVAGLGDSVYRIGLSGAVIDGLQMQSRGLALFTRAGEYVSCGPDSTVTLFTMAGVEKWVNLRHPLIAPPAVGTLSAATGKVVVVLTRDGYLYALKSDLSVADGFPVNTGGPVRNSAALADFTGDGKKEIIFCSGSKVYAYNPAGVLIDHFPLPVPTSDTLLSAPVVADINGDGVEDLVVVTKEGLVCAYDRSGSMLAGFPLLSGPNSGSTPVIMYRSSVCLSCVDIGVAVASDDAHLYAWQTGTVQVGIATPPVQSWPQWSRDGDNSGLFETLAPPVQLYGSAFFPKDRVYNWPNPVDRNHGYRTHIRYYVASASRVHIKIIDLAGDRVTEFDGPGTGGIDNEVEWDVSGIQSGIYFAHVEAQGTDGSSGSAVIKIAVIK